MSIVPRIFPYEYPRLTQVEIWGALRELGEKSTVFLEAPTGVGKTAAILSYLLEKYDKVLWFCYTHKQQEVVLREAERIEERTDIRLNTVRVRGISSLCPVREVREAVFRHQACRYYSAVRGCVQCPYREQFLRALSSRLVVATYAYLKEPYFQKIAPLIDLADVVVFDEAHHLLLPPRIEIPVQWAEKAYNEFKCLFFEKMVNREKVVLTATAPSLLACEEVFWSSGVSYALEIVLRSRHTSKLFLNKKTNSYLGIDEKFHSKLSNVFKVKKAVVTSATLPSILRDILVHGEYFSVERHEYRFYPIIYNGIKLPKRAWKSKGKLREVDWVLSMVSKFYRKVLAVFPSSEVLEKYRRYYEVPGNIIPIVAGSREAEGIDVNANICVVLGVPYDRVTRITIETIKYFRRYTSKPRVLGYTIPAVIKAIQAAGRILRKPNRVIVFYDKRWIKLKKYFPMWLRNSGIKVIFKRSQLYSELVFYSCISII